MKDALVIPVFTRLTVWPPGATARSDAASPTRAKGKWHSGLPDGEIEEIRMLHADGFSIAEISCAFPSVSRSALRQYVRGKLRANKLPQGNNTVAE